MADTMLTFLGHLVRYVAKAKKRECCPYNLDIDEYYFGSRKTRPGFYVVLDENPIGTMTYRFFVCVEVEENLFIGFGFDGVKGNGDEEGVDFDKMRKKNAAFYDKCTAKTETLHIRDFKKENGLWWTFIENTKGEKLNFKRWSFCVVELIDDMDIQVEYMGDYVADKIKKFDQKL